MIMDMVEEIGTQDHHKNATIGIVRVNVRGGRKAFHARDNASYVAKKNLVAEGDVAIMKEEGASTKEMTTAITKLKRKNQRLRILTILTPTVLSLDTQLKKGI